MKFVSSTTRTHLLLLCLTSTAASSLDPDLTVVMPASSSSNDENSALIRRMGKQYVREEESEAEDANAYRSRGRSRGRQVVVEEELPQPRLPQAEELVSDIHCVRTHNTRRFAALLRLPRGLDVPPVLEERKHDDDACIIESVGNDLFALELSDLEKCGVRECDQEGEQWLCLLLRYPLMSGLKLPEDEVLEIRCKPQERRVEGRNALNFQKNEVEQLSPTIYLGGGHDFLSEIGLFRRLGGTELYASRVGSGSTIELGENVQLRSIVRSGDGWQFSRITDVVVHRVQEGQPLYDEQSTAVLIADDGCRNKDFRLLAPDNPWRDPGNSLVNNFDFRVFMFQSMSSGDSIMITAKVVACVEEVDCAPTRCADDRDPGYGRRRRRRYARSLSNSTSLPPNSKTRRWEENLELKIRLPDDLLRPQRSLLASEKLLSKSNIEISAGECKLYLTITLGVALTFCLLSAVVVLIACLRRCQEVRHRKRLRDERNADANDAKTEPTSRMSNRETTNMETSVPYLMSDSSSELQQWRQVVLAAQAAHLAMSQSRPATVRSVKRRDKAKWLTWDQNTARRNHVNALNHINKNEEGDEGSTSSTEAVMV